MAPSKFDFEVEGLEGTGALEDDPVEEPQQESFPEATENVVSDLYTEPEAAPTESEFIDTRMSAVEERLEVAQYYRLLLNDSLFKNNPTNASRRVEKEIRAFVHQRLEILLGVKHEVAERQKVESPFTAIEIQVLKDVAGLALKRSNKFVDPPAPPTLNKMEERKSAVVAQPALNKPQLKVSQQQPIRKPVVAAKPPARQPGLPAGATSIAVDDSRIPPEYKQDPTLHQKGGHVYVQARNDSGSPLWLYDPILKRRTMLPKDVTLPARPAPGQPQPIPPIVLVPGNEHVWNNIMQSQGDAMMGLAEAKATRMGIGNHLTQAVVSHIGEEEPNE